MTDDKKTASLLDPSEFIRTTAGSKSGYWVKIDQIDGGWPGSDLSRPALLVAGAWIDTDAETYKRIFGDLI